MILLRATALAAMAMAAPSPAAGEPAQSSPPGFTMERKGSLHDFDFLEGGWTTIQNRLRTGPDGEHWESFPGNLCMGLYLDGGATVDELYFPTRKSAGLSLRTFDRTTHQWSIYWVNGQSGRLDPIPVVGGFNGDRGEFYAIDRVEGRPAKVRYLWTIVDRDHARWEQALSFGDGQWHTNWTADFTRGDTAKLCADGKPRR